MKLICSLGHCIRRQTHHCKAVFLYKQFLVVPRLKQLATGLSPFISGFILTAVPVTFLEDKVPLGQVFLPVLRLFFGRTNLQILHNRRTANGRIKADSHIACRAHAMPMPCSDRAVLSRPRHSTALERRSASSGYHAEFHEDCHQKHTNPPHNDPYLRL